MDINNSTDIERKGILLRIHITSQIHQLHVDSVAVAPERHIFIGQIVVILECLHEVMVQENFLLAVDES